MFASPVVVIVLEPAATAPMKLPAVTLPVPVMTPVLKPKLPTLALPVVVIVLEPAATMPIMLPAERLPVVVILPVPVLSVPATLTPVEVIISTLEVPPTEVVTLPLAVLMFTFDVPLEREEPIVGSAHCRVLPAP